MKGEHGTLNGRGVGCKGNHGILEILKGGCRPGCKGNHGTLEGCGPKGTIEH